MAVGFCCVNCFEDHYLKKRVGESGRTGDCDYCGSKKVPVEDTSIIAVIVRAGLQRAYECVEAAGTPVQRILDDERAFSDLLQPAAVSRLVSSLLENHHSENADESPSYGPDALLMARGSGWEFEDLSWPEFQYDVKHYSRFFRPGLDAEERFLSYIGQVLPYLKTPLEKGCVVYRARIVTDCIPDDRLAQEFGPPTCARNNNRMSPVGISYLYVSDSPQTCIAEARPPVGSDVCVAALEGLRDSCILDLTQLPSIFDPAIDLRLWHSKSFLRDFIRDVAQPVLPEDSVLDYIPTQVFSEFIRNRNYKGMRYPTSQGMSGSNYVFFCGQFPPDDTGDLEVKTLEPYTDWFRLKHIDRSRILGVKYKTSVSRRTIAVAPSPVP
jgi:hypothetical protein